jgi:hypothetical protein
VKRVVKEACPEVVEGCEEEGFFAGEENAPTETFGGRLGRRCAFAAICGF